MYTHEAAEHLYTRCFPHGLKMAVSMKGHRDGRFIKILVFPRELKTYFRNPYQEDLRNAHRPDTSADVPVTQEQEDPDYPPQPSVQRLSEE